MLSSVTINCQVTSFLIVSVSNINISSHKLKISKKNCHEKLSSKIVIKNCRQKLSSKIVVKNCCHKLSSKIVIRNCHKSLGLLYNCQ